MCTLSYIAACQTPGCMRAALFIFLCGCGAAHSLAPEGVAPMGIADAGIDGGADAREVICTELDFSSPTEVRGRYAFSLFGGANMVQLTKGTDALQLELWYRGLNERATFPWPVMLWPTHRAECETCVVLRRECVGELCARTLLAIGGQVTFDEATRDWVRGRFAGEASVLRLSEWNLMDDEPVRGGQCVELHDVSFDARWDTADAGP